MNDTTTRKVRNVLCIFLVSFLFPLIGLSQTAYITTSYDAALQSRATIQSDALSIIPADTRLKTTHYRAGYFQVNHDDTRGWVSNSVVDRNAAASLMRRLSGSSTTTPSTRTVPTRRSTAVRCSATTLKGARCKRRTKNISGRCWQH